MFKQVENFERRIASFYGAPYAVATDCCTHGLELSLLYTKTNQVTIPKHTYISVPFTAKKLGIPLTWSTQEWRDYYYISNEIIDAAVFWKESGYIPNTFMCLSFQFKKHLSLGRGGSILVQNKKDYIALKKLSYDGRLPNQPWASQDIDTFGYHYYMTPETAEQGIEKFEYAAQSTPKKWCWSDYPDLTLMSVFKNK